MLGIKKIKKICRFKTNTFLLEKRKVWKRKRNSGVEKIEGKIREKGREWKGRERKGREGKGRVGKRSEEKKKMIRRGKLGKLRKINVGANLFPEYVLISLDYSQCIINFVKS